MIKGHYWVLYRSEPIWRKRKAFIVCITDTHGGKLQVFESGDANGHPLEDYHILEHIRI